MEYRVDELAARAGMSVDTVRFYQARGLLPAPVRSGRLAWYSDDHLERLSRIRDLKEKGFTLATIRRLLAGEVDPADQALIAAVAGPLPGETGDGPEELMTLEELAARSGFSLGLLEALQREGLLIPRSLGGEDRFTQADVGAARAGLALLEAGLPIGELLALARNHDRAVRRTAERAVALFEQYVRGPIRASAASEEEAAQRLVEAFQRLLPATTHLVAHHFRRVLLAAAQARIERIGAEEEIAAVRSFPEPLEAGAVTDKAAASPRSS